MARAGSKHISRQNLRLVNDKPLINYVLEKAIEQPSSDIVVSTDSQEISEFSKTFGAKVIMRPKNLTDDDTPIEKIVYHVLTKLLNNGFTYENCLVLHPHFPLIKKKTIQKFLYKLSNSIETIYGFYESDDEQFIKLSNSQNFPKLKKSDISVVQKKKIVSFKCKNFLKNKNFQKPSFGIKLSDSEIFSLTSYHDFGLLEKILTAKKILVRVHASEKMGLGHVYNMLTVLNNIRNEEIFILIEKNNNLAIKKFKEHLYDVRTFSTNHQLYEIIKKIKPDIIFNDILNTEKSYMQNIKKSNAFVVNFEDLGPGRKYADLVFNPIFNSKSFSKNEFFGYNYACVRDEFRIWKRAEIRKNAKNVFISFGGTDPENLTFRTMEIINKLNLTHLNFFIILGFGYSKKQYLEKLIANMKKNGFRIKTIEKSDFIAKYAIDADFAITSNGRTVFELAALNIPLISISVNSREEQHTFVKSTHTGYYLNSNQINEKQISSAIQKMLNFQNRTRITEKLQKIDLLSGTHRVIEIIFDEYEKFNKSRREKILS